VKSLPESILLRAQSLPEGGHCRPRNLLIWTAVSRSIRRFSWLRRPVGCCGSPRGTDVAPVSGRFGLRATASGMPLGLALRIKLQLTNVDAKSRPGFLADFLGGCRT
jgi:hypothetical protein